MPNYEMYEKFIGKEIKKKGDIIFEVRAIPHKRLKEERKNINQQPTTWKV